MAPRAQAAVEISLHNLLMLGEPCKAQSLENAYQLELFLMYDN